MQYKLARNATHTLWTLHAVWELADKLFCLLQSGRVVWPTSPTSSSIYSSRTHCCKDSPMLVPANHLKMAIKHTNFTENSATLQRRGLHNGISLPARKALNHTNVARTDSSSERVCVPPRRPIPTLALLMSVMFLVRPKDSLSFL